jgi:hypothetical protein
MKLEKGDFVKYKIMASDEDGKPTNEILEDGEAQILDIQKNGNLMLSNGSGLIALPEECQKIKPKVRGNWNVSCDIECPKCGHDNDLMDIDEWYLLSKPGENKEFNKPEEFSCKKCGFEMLIEGTDY